jgi:uncharacterized protein
MIFVDTGAWYALSDAGERRHSEAVSFFRKATKGEFGRLVTTDYVLDETYTLLRLRLGTDPVRRLAELLRQSQNTQLLRISDGDFDRALALLLARDKLQWSFTDCTSFVVMEALGIRTAFGFDPNFREAGFALRPETEP